MTGDVSVRPGKFLVWLLNITDPTKNESIFLDGSIHMTSPHHLWHLDSKFVFNGVVISVPTISNQPFSV